MSLTRIPAIFSGGAWNALYPAVKFARGLIYEGTYHKIEFYDAAGGAPGLVETKGQSYGQEIQVSGRFNFDDLDSAKLAEEDLEELLIGEDGKPKTVDLCEWVDSGGGRLGIWRGCVLAGEIGWPPPDRTLKRQEYNFVLRTPYSRRFATGSDGSVPEASGAWAGYYGQSGGGIVAPTGGTVIVAKQAVMVPVMFAGIVDEATGANAENVARLQRRVVLSTQSAMVIKSIHIRNAVPAETGGGTTTARVANAAWDGAITASMSCSVGAAATYCAPVTTGAFVVAAGSPAWVNFTAAGLHSGVEIMLEVIAV